MWKIHGVKVDERPTYGYRLMDDEHLAHLLDLPATTYLIYRPYNEPENKWVQANTEGIETFTDDNLVLYRHQNVDVSECRKLTCLMRVVNEFEVELATDSEDSGDAKIVSEGWSASSIFSYPSDCNGESESDCGELDETEPGDHAVQEQEGEVIPSSQGSLE